MNGLNTYVHVVDESGLSHAFGPADDLPQWAFDKIGAHCFEGGVKPSKSPTKPAEGGKR